MACPSGAGPQAVPAPAQPQEWVQRSAGVCQRARSPPSLATVKLRWLISWLGLVGFAVPLVAAPAVTNVPPADVFALKPFEWIPPFPTPRLAPAIFPRDDPIAAVERLAFGDHRLWLVVRRRFDTNAVGGEGRLWAFTPELNRLQPVKGAVAANVVSGLLFHDQRLWIAAHGGVGAIDTQTFSVTGYNETRGLFATNFAGIDLLGDSVAAFGRSGGLFSLSAGGASFVRLPGTAPVTGPVRLETWEHFAASEQWALAAAGTNVVTRNLLTAQWLPLGAELDRESPRLLPARVQCVTGDGEGGFWLGTDAGLHRLDSETGRVENQFAAPGPLVKGGLDITVAPGFQLTPVAYRQAEERVMDGIRDRMRERARRARARREGREVTSWVEPTSRLPGGVTALLHDNTWLWVACSDGLATNRSRVLLQHVPSRRWVGWFPLGLPVRSMASDARYLWLGLDDSRGTGAPTLVALEKLPLISLPQGRWVKDALAPEELTRRLAALSPKERALYAFFANDPATVAQQLAPGEDPRAEADAESLFLLAFAHDAIGLNQPDKLDAYATHLRQRFPDSLFTRLAAQARPKPVAPIEPAPAAEAETAEAALERRDLNGDGKLNAVELRLWRGAETKLTDFDRNGDGLLDRSEVAELLTRPAP